ncbi:o-spanin [Stenotrophomonas phage BUCT609]|uniref:O-spanin n=1 Tax=Stenotrophomonas phage BUCT609 TaxID=2834250 RepID=A0A8E6URR8_9CAUD|nr:o-spanin [Stenotrophomonas phage BUCT609]
MTYLPDGPATNAAVIKLAVDREFDVKRCNVDKAALREFVKSHPKVRMKN